MGLTPPRSGIIRFSGKEIQKLSAYLIPRLGIGYVPQGRRIFPLLTVLENLRTPVIDTGREKKMLNEVFDFFPRLSERASQAGGTLSGGEQQMLAIARAMMCGPKLMILDEPTEGLMPLMVTLVKKSIVTMNRERNVDILLVEQNLETALEVCQRLYVIERGTMVYEKGICDFNRSELLHVLGI